MEWRAYEVTLVEDKASQAGQRELLYLLNGTFPSANSALLNVPKLAFEYGLHKLVFKFEVVTNKPGVVLYREAFTYINVIKSPLEPILVEGSITKVSRGWEQDLELKPQELSVDPDYPDDKVTADEAEGDSHHPQLFQAALFLCLQNFNFTWFCRKVAPAAFREEYPAVDAEGYPLYNATDPQPIPGPSSAHLINPPAGEHKSQ